MNVSARNLCISIRIHSLVTRIVIARGAMIVCSSIGIRIYQSARVSADDGSNCAFVLR